MLDISRRVSCDFRRYVGLWFFLLLGVACVPHAEPQEIMLAPLPSPPGLSTVADWEKLFLGNWDAEHMSKFLAESLSGDSWQLYDLAYGIDGNTAMYRATGKTQYLDRALLYATNAVNSARDSWSLPGSQFKDSYRGWASQNPETPGEEVALNESYCWRYVTRLLRVIRETPVLFNDSRYRKSYYRLLQFSEKDIFEKWFVRGANNFIYRENTHMTSHWATIAMNLALMTTDETRKARYLEVFNNINRGLPNHASSLREQMSASAARTSALFWSDEWGSHDHPGQDVSHGNGVVAFIVEARDAGMEWTDEDVLALASTLDTVIWPSAEEFAEYVDGSGSGNGWFNDGFMKLGRYSVNLQHRLETHVVGHNTQYYGNGALNVRLLSEASTH